MATQTKLQPRTTSSGSVAAKVFSLANVSSKGTGAPGRWGLHSAPGFGKTSLLAYARKPIFIMTRGETGLDALIGSGQLPDTPHFPEVQTWGELINAIETLLNVEHEYKTLVIDTGNGCERLCHEYICNRDFSDDWGERGFTGYMRGYEVALGEWRLFLNLLDELRIKKGMTVFLLFHTKIKTFKNPSGADYDRYAPEMHEKTWALTKGWLDAILFGNFEVTVTAQGRDVTNNSSKKGKAGDLSHRIIYTSSENPTFDAKNRLGLPPEIEMGDSAKQGWANLAQAIVDSRKAGFASTTTTPAVAEVESGNHE